MSETVSIDGLLAERLNIMINAYEAQDGALFKTAMFTFESLLATKKEVYKNFKIEVDKLKEAVGIETEEITGKSKSKNVINKKIFIDSQMDRLRWDYKRAYLKKAIECLTKAGIIYHSKKVGQRDV